MSQAKVDQYKKAKANRKKEMRKEKIERTLAGIGAFAIAAAICVWIGFSVYNKANGSNATAAGNSTVKVNTDAVNDYLSELNEEES